MMGERQYPEVGVVSSSLCDIDLSSPLQLVGAYTRSELIACVGVIQREKTPCPHTESSVERDVYIHTNLCGQRVCIGATLGQNICLATAIVDIITNILLLCDEEYEFALATEEGVLVDIREIVR